MLSLIDRYISKKFLLYFLGGLFVFVTIFLAVDFLSFIMRNQVSLDVAIRYYAYYLPSIVYQLIPVGCLLATVFTVSNMNRSNELVVLFSLGHSLARICAPILVIVALISAMSFWLGDQVLPRFEQKKNYVKYVEIENKPGLYSTVTTNKIWYRSQNILFNIQTLDAEKGRAQGMTLYYFDSTWRLVQLIEAEEAKLNENTWTLKDGTVTLFAEESSFPLTKTFEEKKISMSENIADIQSSADSSEVMSLSELDKFIEKNKKAGLDTLRYEVDYHSKFSFAFAAFVMSLMGIPFSVSGRRSGGAVVSLGLCVGLAFFYWALYSSSLTLGKHGMLPPVVAAWSANALMLVFSTFLLVRLKK